MKLVQNRCYNAHIKKFTRFLNPTKNLTKSGQDRGTSILGSGEGVVTSPLIAHPVTVNVISTVNLYRSDWLFNPTKKFPKSSQDLKTAIFRLSGEGWSLPH